MTTRLIAASLCATLAFAAAAAEPERAWAKGVPKAKQDGALQLFRDGNAALKESLFVKAAAKYREALALWDHPAIHYNLALVLVNLDQPLETHEHLLAALKYGEAPLDSDKFAQATRYRSLIEKQLATVEVRCDNEGALVKLDGRVLFTGPGRYSGLVRAGLHTLTASREGMLTLEQSENIPGGEKKTYDLKLLSAEQLTEYRRQWSVYIPWAVVGGGAVVLGGGVAAHLAARNAFLVYDARVKGCVELTPSGCLPSVELSAQRSKGDTYQALGFTGYAIGGAALIAGGVLVYLNRLQPYQLSTDLKASVSVAPWLGPDGAGAVVSLGF